MLHNILVFSQVFVVCFSLVPTSQELGICSIIGAITAVDLYSDWVCDTDLIPVGDVCTWGGIVCDGTDIIVIDLEDINISLSGTIPPEIGLLVSLKNFSVPEHYLSDVLPTEIVTLSNLLFPLLLED